MALSTTRMGGELTPRICTGGWSSTMSTRTIMMAMPRENGGNDYSDDAELDTDETIIALTRSPA